MGTSTSSAGPRSNVSFDPAWLDSIGETSGNGDGGNDGGQQQPPGQAPQQGPQAQPQIAPARRFAGAKRNLGKFASTGSHESLGRGIGQYSRSGMGGAAQAARRMRATTRGGASLVSFLQSVAANATPEVTAWVDTLTASEPTVDVVIDAIVNTVMPPGGSIDEESMRDSMALALSDLVVLNPDCDLLHMTPNDTWTLMQFYLGQEVCNRLRFDAGQFFESARLNPAAAVARELEMRNFVRSEIGVQLRALRANNPNPTRRQLDSIMEDALRLTFAVYEGLL